MTEQLTRINKYLSEVGYCSRRAADKLIEAGRVPLMEKFLKWELKFHQKILLKLMGN